MTAPLLKVRLNIVWVRVPRALKLPKWYSNIRPPTMIEPVQATRSVIGGSLTAVWKFGAC